MAAPFNQKRGNGLQPLFNELLFALLTNRKHVLREAGCKKNKKKAKARSAGPSIRSSGDR